MSSTSMTCSPGCGSMYWRKRSGSIFDFALRPVDALGLQRFADAVSDRQSAGGRGDDGKLGNHRADFGIGAQQAAQRRR